MFSLLAAMLTLGLTSVCTLVSASKGQLPSNINLTYPGETVDMKQKEVRLGLYLLDEANIDDTTTGILEVGVVLPNGSIIDSDIQPWTEFKCGKSILAADVSVPGPFLLNGSYTAYWNLTYYLASNNAKEGSVPDNRDKHACGSGPYKSVSQNFTATFEVGLSASSTTQAPKQTTLATQFPSPTGTLTSGDVTSMFAFSSVRATSAILALPLFALLFQ